MGNSVTVTLNHWAGLLPINTVYDEVQFAGHNNLADLDNFQPHLGS